MPAISPHEAIARLTSEVKVMGPADLREFYHELFPTVPKSPVLPDGDLERNAILDQLRRGVEIEEILDLWNVAFPEAHEVHYDDENEMIRFSIRPRPVSFAE